MFKHGIVGAGVKSVALAGGVVCSILAGASGAYAAQGDVAVYQVTIKQIELCTDLYCTESFVVSSDQQDLDIASASAGAEAGAMASTAKPAIGKTYTHVGITMSRAFQIRGVSRNSDCVTTGDGAIGTRANGDDGANTPGGSANSVDGASTITTYIHSDAVYPNDIGQEANWGDLVNAVALTWVGGDQNSAPDARIVYALTSSYTVKETAPVITVTIDTQNTIYDGSGNCGDGLVNADQAALNIVDPIVNMTID